MFESFHLLSPWVRDVVAVGESTSLVPGIALAALIVTDHKHEAKVIVVAWLAVLAIVALISAVLT